MKGGTNMKKVKHIESGVIKKVEDFLVGDQIGTHEWVEVKEDLEIPKETKEKKQDK